jgi:hypothetical protein
MKAAVALAVHAIAYEKAFAVYFPAPARAMAEAAAVVPAAEGIDWCVGPGGDSIACVRCRNVSHHPADVAHFYCGCCHVFHDRLRGLTIAATPEPETAQARDTR